MKLKSYLSSNSYESLAKSAITELADFTSLQLRHHLKENWDNFISLVKSKNIYDDVSTMIDKSYHKNIEAISSTKPCDLIIGENYITDMNIKDIYDQISSLVNEHNKVTMNALLWAALCNMETKTRFKNYIKSTNNTTKK